MNIMTYLKQLLKTFFKTSVYVTPVAFTFFDVFGYVCRVEGNSMKPLINNDKERNYVFLCRWGHKNYKFQRGEVVCLASPTNPSQRLLKRVIALEGDTVKSLTYKDEFVTIPKGYCWVEGDNHKKSLDSNIFGPIPIGLIDSKATHIVWPPKDFEPIPIMDVSSRIQKHEDLANDEPPNVDVAPTKQHYFISSIRSA